MLPKKLDCMIGQLGEKWRVQQARFVGQLKIAKVKGP